LDRELCEAVLQAYKDRLKQSDIVCLQDYNKGLITLSLCRQLIKLASQANKKVIVDPSLTSDYSKYAGATVITPNRKEASTAVNFEIKTTKDAAKAADKLIDEFKFKAVVITLDKEGAYLKTETESQTIPTRPRSVYDVSGAGDMVLATIAVALAADCDYTTAVQLANIAGGIEVEKFGTTTVSIEEIINEIISQNRDKSSKFHELDSLLQELTWHRKQKKTIVFTNGCFDVIHRGHIELLKFCKSQGDIVILGLNSDSSVKIIKGPDRPVNNQDDRSAVLAALETIDYVILFDEPDPLNLINEVKPDVLVKGQDWQDKGVVGSEFVESYGGKIVFAPLIEGKSSTETVEKMKVLGIKPDRRKKRSLIQSEQSEAT